MKKESQCDLHGSCWCLAKDVLEIIGKKWTVCLVSILDIEKPMRFNELRNTIYHISPKALSDTLKVLEEEGLVLRTTYAEIPPRVEYTLTQKGAELKDVLQPLLEWASAQSKSTAL